MAFGDRTGLGDRWDVWPLLDEALAGQTSPLPGRESERGAPAFQHAHGHLGSPEEKGRGQAQSAGLGRSGLRHPQAQGQGDTEEPPGEAGGRKSALGGRRPGLLQEGRLP